MHCPFISLILKPHCIQRGLCGREGLETFFNVGCAKSYLTSSAHLKTWRFLFFKPACKLQEEVDALWLTDLHTLKWEMQELAYGIS